MTAEEDPPRIPIPASIRALLWGTDEPRLRASWRVLLSWGLLFIWSVIAALAGGLTQPYWGTLPGPAQQILDISVGTAIFLVLFALFARYIDRRPLSDYGFTRSPTWLAELAIGFLAVNSGSQPRVRRSRLHAAPVLSCGRGRRTGRQRHGGAVAVWRFWFRGAQALAATGVCITSYSDCCEYFRPHTALTAVSRLETRV